MRDQKWLTRCAGNAQVFLLGYDGSREGELQKFLEQHPPCVPWAHDTVAHQGPAAYGDFLIAQPLIFGEKGRRIPDFMWIATNSGTLRVTLIELERGGKVTFNQDETPNAEFNQARGQLNQWRLAVSENRDDFIKHHKIRHMLAHRNLVFNYGLLYGRRDEFYGSGIHKTRGPYLQQLRGQMSQSDEDYASVDRIREAPHTLTASAITVQRAEQGTLRVISVPPTFRTGPKTPQLLRETEGLREAIEKLSDRDLTGQRGRSKKRVRYLLDRCDYWDGAYKNWVRSTGATDENDGWSTRFNTE